MKKTIAGLLILVGLIHLGPIIGALGAEQLSTLYGLSFEEVNISILMRHRAFLFGILGSFIIYSAFKPSLQPLAFIAGFISVLSFIGISFSIGNYNDEIRKVIIIDIVAMACLSVAVVLYIIDLRKS